MSYALKATLGYGLEAAHDVLEIGADVLQFVPIPALQEAARVLLTIWDALQLVEVSHPTLQKGQAVIELFAMQTNRMACLRLTERCADILVSVHAEVHEGGDKVSEELRLPLSKLVEYGLFRFSSSYSMLTSSFQVVQRGPHPPAKASSPTFPEAVSKA